MENGRLLVHRNELTGDILPVQAAPTGGFRLRDDDGAAGNWAVDKNIAARQRGDGVQFLQKRRQQWKILRREAGAAGIVG